jgi:sialate O-acetylesterase
MSNIPKALKTSDAIESKRLTHCQIPVAHATNWGFSKSETEGRPRLKTALVSKTSQNGRLAWATQHIIPLCLLALLGSPLRAQPILPHLFSDHMILQRDEPINVWGWAEPGERISVSLGESSSATTTGSDGRWRVILSALRAGGPFVLRVQGNKTIEFKDVVLGEVWVASGQSNMTYALSGATGAAEEIPKAAYSQIRFFTVPKMVSQTPESDTLPAAWEVCTPDTAKDFSAVGYFFATKLYKALGVPIGIILSAWPGSTGEEWTDPDLLRREPILQPIFQKWDALPAIEKSSATEPTEFSLEFDDFELLPGQGDSHPPVTISNFDDGRSRTESGGDWTYDWLGAPQTSFELVAPGRGGSGYAARVEGKLDGGSSSVLQASYHPDHSPSELSDCAGIRFWVRGNGSFQFQSLQPTISDWDNYSTEIQHATPEWKQVTIWFKDLKQAGWGVAMPFTPNALSGFQFAIMTAAGDVPLPPSGLYEGMITPLENYRIRGAIWYQGEGNTWRAFQYRTLLPALIKGWRKAWGEGDFPFLIVQLPNQGQNPELSDSIWAELREAQLFTEQGVPNTGLAVSIDVGDPKNLHPPRKAEIGERLALWALGTTYGQKIIYSGPLYDSMRVEGNQIRIHFDHTGSGLQVDGEKLEGFSIAGADRKFHWASARIDGHDVVVSSEDVIAPVAVRYAWADSPECNLYNAEGLPASPFRTDDWPGATFGNR